MALRTVGKSPERQGRLGGVLVWVLAALLCLSAGELCAREKKKPEPSPQQFSNLSFVVVRDSDGTPLKNASVVIHFVRADGTQDSQGFQLKTDSEGRAAIGDIPYGRMRLQAIAHGLRTYGEDVEINAAQQDFVIRLQRPADQVSIYK